MWLLTLLLLLYIVTSNNDFEEKLFGQKNIFALFLDKVHIYFFLTFLYKNSIKNSDNERVLQKWFSPSRMASLCCDVSRTTENRGSVLLDITET